ALILKDAIQHDINRTEWIDRLLAKRFFDQCATHCAKKNYLNRYCIDCDSSYRKSCVASGSHNERHKILTIYRHVYNDVVPLEQMEDHIDCSNIQ
ncbi:Hypothetical predicted protein, partial [Olea europaea subsp. europaea]